MDLSSYMRLTLLQFVNIVYKLCENYREILREIQEIIQCTEETTISRTHFLLGNVPFVSKI
jgi:hypothetical protein